MTVAALMIILLLFGGCARGGDKGKFETFRAELAAASEVRMTAEIEADFGGSARAYTLAMTATAEGSVVEVLMPELIKGVKARIGNDGNRLEYDGVILDTGELTGDGLTPISALPRLTDTLGRGHVDGVWREGEHIAVKLIPDDVIILTVWFNAQTFLPERAELMDQAEGRTVVRCEITAFELIS